MNFQFSKILFLIFLCTFIFNPSFSASNKKIIVNEIIVKNNQRIDTETIISYLGLQKGNSLLPLH